MGRVGEGAAGMVSKDGYAAAKADARECFGFVKDVSHQERCHAYCREHGLLRGWDEPATEVVVLHLMARAYEAGKADARSENPRAVDMAACELELAAQELADRAAELRGA